MKVVLADAGPLVALFNPRDRFHAWTRARFDEFTEPMVTCEAVLAETLFLATKVPGACARILALWHRDLLQLTFSAEQERVALQRLLTKYADLPISLADACLIRMSEIHSDSLVWTVDRHFSIYRRHGRQVVPTLMPDA
ncbi:MAG TPA: PIN domain-containing protein [Chthoniobacterales bacterium]